MNTDKALQGRGDLTEKEYLKKLENLTASETAAEENSLSEFMDMKYQIALDKFLENNPDKSEKDFQDSIRRLSLESGGKVIKFFDYQDPIKKVKEIDLAGLFTPGKTLSSLTDEEREVVNKLLRMTMGKGSE